MPGQERRPNAPFRTVSSTVVITGGRGGTFSTTVGPSGYAITLDKCSFSEDVQVSGTISYVLFSSLNASLTVRGTGTGGGSLNVTGTFVAPGPVGNFQVTGTLGGAAVAVQVPEA